MAKRLFAVKWLCCMFVVYSIFGRRSVHGVTVRPVPGLSGIEDQAKFFQDFFSTQLSPYKIEFGHVCEDPHTWEQRYEKKDFENHRDMGKVRWGDKNGGYGEHYWDLNHAGNTGSHGGDEYNDDDGSNEDPSDGYNDHSDEHFEPESYASDEKPQYEESGRAKRAHSRSKGTTDDEEHDHDDEEPPRRRQRKDRKNKYHRERHEEIHEEEDSDEEATNSPKFKNNSHRGEEVTIKPKKNERTKTRQSTDRPEIKNIKKNEQSIEDLDQRQSRSRSQGREKNHFVLVVNQKEKQDTPKEEEMDPNRVFNNEGGSSGQNFNPEAVPAAAASRLFIEAQTGHIVDRMTGQAYVLRPLASKNYN